jgi:hypothetical protein
VRAVKNHLDAAGIDRQAVMARAKLNAERHSEARSQPNRSHQTIGRKEAQKGAKPIHAFLRLSRFFAAK